MSANRLSLGRLRKALRDRNIGGGSANTNLDSLAESGPSIQSQQAQSAGSLGTQVQIHGRATDATSPGSTAGLSASSAPALPLSPERLTDYAGHEALTPSRLVRVAENSFARDTLSTFTERHASLFLSDNHEPLPKDVRKECAAQLAHNQVLSDPSQDLSGYETLSFRSTVQPDWVGISCKLSKAEEIPGVPASAACWYSEIRLKDNQWSVTPLEELYQDQGDVDLSTPSVPASPPPEDEENPALYTHCLAF